MTTLLITTQILENYGTAEDPYWKAKFGCNYKVRNVPLNLSDENYAELLLAAQIQENGEFYQEFVIGCEYVADDYLTDFEKSQLEYDGSILYPAQEFFYEDLVNNMTVEA